MIETQLLHDVAEFVDGRVAKVVLNESYEINIFDVKEAIDGTLTLNYIVPAAEVPLVTLIELKDDADRLLSSNTVHVPISSDTKILQTIEVKEVP